MSTSPGVAQSTLGQATAALRLAIGEDRVLTASAVLDDYSHDTWPLSTVASQLGRHEHRPDVVVQVAAENTSWPSCRSPGSTRSR